MQEPDVLRIHTHIASARVTDQGGLRRVELLLNDVSPDAATGLIAAIGMDCTIGLIARPRRDLKGGVITWPEPGGTGQSTSA